MTTTPTSGAADPLAMVSKALREAYNLGMMYWQQADSEYISQHKKADDTRAKFMALVEETCAALAAGQATASPTQPAQAAEPFGYVHQLPSGSEVFARTRDFYPNAVPVFTAPQPTHAQAGALPLDDARRMFDAGWKAAALFCDREDVVADGIIGFGACPQFEAAFSAAHGIKGGQHGNDT